MAEYRVSRRKALRKRARDCCERCGRFIKELGPNPHDGSRHHRHKQCQGGNNRLYNLVLVCVKCHRWIHAHEKLAAKEGWLLPCDTAAAPIKRHDGWAMLHPDGTLEHMSDFAGKALLSWVLDSLYLETLAPAQ